MITLFLLFLGCSGTDSEDTASSCPSDPARFEEQIWEPVLGRQCVLCHQEAGLASSTRMVFWLEGEPGWLAHNEEVARSAALLDVDEGPAILLKPTDLSASGHGGGAVLDEADEGYEALAALVSWSRGQSCSALDALETCDAEAPGPRLLRRLSHEEYDHSVRDLLGVDAGLAEGFPADDRVEGFSTNAEALDVSALLADDYRQAAETLAWEAELDALLPCDPDVDGERACAESLFRTLGRRTFRRPLTEEDVSRYLGRWEAGASGADFEEGLRWMIAAMLQSPYFLYRLELGVETDPGTYVLTDYELATELSYLLWATTPDDTLLDAAERGELSTPGGLAAQLARLRADTRARGRTADFVQSWLGLDRLATVSRDAATYPSFTDEVRADMAGETRLFVESVARAGGSFGDLFTAPYTFLTPALARHYGVSMPERASDGWYRRVSTDGSGRGGLLGQGSVLTTYALSGGSSPIHRGLLVRERILCEELPDPPASLNVTTPEPTDGLSTRETYAQHATDASCAVCHQLLDPVGFGFEHLDGVGVWRDLDAGQAVDASGEILYSRDSDGAFDGIPTLSAKLADSPAAQRCYAQMWFVWATGLEGEEGTDCAAKQLADGYAAGEMPVADSVDALVRSTHFATRQGEAGLGDSPARAE